MARAGPAGSATRRRLVGLAGLAVLALAAIGLAAPGPGLVPGAVGGGPGWLRGVYGEGLAVGGGAYYALLWTAFWAHLAVAWGARALGARLVWAAVVALVAGFALAPPLLSQDVFSYVAYARLGAEHGLNPYDLAPAAVPADPVLAHLGWRDTVSAYGPAFTLVTYPLGLVSVAAALWTLKAAMALAVLGLAALVARLAVRRGVEPLGAACLVALNPLVLAHVVGGAHNDALMMLIALAGVAAVLASREAAGGAALVLAASIKVSGAFLAPFALAGAARRGRLLGGAALAAVAIGAVTLAAFGGSATDALGLVGENQALTSRYSIPAILARLAGIDVEPVRIAALALYAAAALGLLAWAWRGGDWIRAAGWAALGLLLATGWLLPWYLIWALPLAALGRDRLLLGGVLSLTAFQLVNRVPL